MGVSQTSIWGYDAQKYRLGDKQRQVYEALRDIGMANNQEIADHLGWQINCVTGRINELEHKGFVQVEMIGKNKFGRNVKFWSTKDQGDTRLERIRREYIH